MVEDTDLLQVLPGKQALIRDILVAFAILGATVLAIGVTLSMQLNANRVAPAVIGATALPAAPTPALCTTGSCAVSPVPVYTDVPITGRTLGSADAPVKVILYSDFQCPPCKQVDLTLLEPLVQQYIRAGTVQFTYQPVALFGVESERAAEASLCAQDQGQFWPYHDKLFSEQAGENQGTFSIANLKRFAGEAGLDEERFGACLDGGIHRRGVQALNAEAKSRGVEGTPIFFVNDELIQGLVPFDVLRQAIEASL